MFPSPGLLLEMQSPQNLSLFWGIPRLAQPRVGAESSRASYWGETGQCGLVLARSRQGVGRGQAGNGVGCGQGTTCRMGQGTGRDQAGILGNEQAECRQGAGRGGRAGV